MLLLWLLPPMGFTLLLLYHPFTGGLVNTMNLTKKLVLNHRWVSSISGHTRVLPAGNRERAGARDSCTGGEAEFQMKAGNSLLSCKSNSLEPKWV